MATRKSRINTESPTPSSGSESVPTTPTTLPTTRTRGGTRGKLKEPETPTTPATTTDKTEDEDETVKASQEDDEQMEEKEIVAEARKEASRDGSTSARKRRLAALKDEPATGTSTASTTTQKTNEKTSPTAAPTASATIKQEETPPPSDDSGGMSKRPRRSVVEHGLAQKQQPAKVNKRRNSTGSKIEQPARLSSRIKKLKQRRDAKLKRPLLKKPVTAISKPLKAALLSERQQAVAKNRAKVADKNPPTADSTSDSELLKINRRRSDSVSKCSDATDTSSFQETKDSDEMSSATDASSQKIEVKDEIMAKEEDEKPTSKDIKIEEPSELADADGATKTKESETSPSEEKRPIRRLRRNAFTTLLPPKAMSTRSRSETPSKLDISAKSGATETEDNADEKEIVVKVESTDNHETPLHIDTALEKESLVESAVSDDVTIGDEKSDSLSPVLVSEGVSEISVKQFYGRADFLENNLGIEEDPKLGEIVQVKEKLKQDESDTKLTVIDNNNAKKDGEETEAETEADTEDIKKESDDEPEKIDVSDSKDKLEKSIVNAMIEHESADDDEAEDDVDDEEEEDEASADDLEIIHEKEEKKKLNVNMLDLGSEIEVRPKENKKVGTKPLSDNENVGEVVLFAITNGVRAKPETLETVLENQKRKNSSDSEAKPSIESTDNIEENVEESVQANDKNSVIDSKESTEIILVADNDAPAPSAQPIEEHQETIDDAKSDNKDEPMEFDEEPTKMNSVSDADEDSNGSDVNKENINTSENEEQKIDAQGKNHSKNKAADVISPRSESLQVSKQKETHLKTLGLLTHQEAVAVTIEKEKRREQRKSSVSAASSSTSSNGKGKKNIEYTGTLKTVIKLHKKNKGGRMPLKMTLHKGRGKNGNSVDRGDGSSAGNSEEDTYYTIHNEMDNDTSHGGHSRKTHYRSHITDTSIATNEPIDTTVVKEVEKALVIPEKASSFRYHPGKLCQDQCFYCGGKFGLFDTPCHVAQIKSEERQKKILENEEKLTVDNCLCDACFRHVDRRANCPSYKKRLSAPPVLTETVAKDDHAMQQNGTTDAALFKKNKEPTWCRVINCRELASHSMRRKWAIRMRKSLSNMIQINFDHSNHTAFLAICDKHYENISPIMVCALCNSRLKRNHIQFINLDSTKLEQILSSQGIPVLISSTPVVCKRCGYYVSLLMKPYDEENKQFLNKYRQNLLNFHNVELVEDDADDDEADDQHNSSGRRGRFVKRAGRKSTPDLSTPSSANSDDVTIINDSATGETIGPLRSERQRLKKLQHEQQMLLDQQRYQDPSKQRQLDTSNEDISLLRTNPNISMRELFPGEEEMGLQVNIPFSAGSGWRTPEGWTKVQTTVQYDDSTRRLWEELQKPYGNQSSFLRHLILLEKFFRNGDLALTSNANSNAITYSTSVQNRLKSYDNMGTNATSSPLAQLLSNPATTITSISTPRALNSAVTIMQTSKLPSSTVITKPPPAAATESTSLLKTNRTSSYTITTEPINPDKSSQSSQSSQSAQSAQSAQSTNKNIANKQIVNANAPKTNKSSIGMPPELISINNTNTDCGNKPLQQSLSQQYQEQMQLTLQQQFQQKHQNSLLLLQQQQQEQPQKQPHPQTISTISISTTPKKTNSAVATNYPTTIAPDGKKIIRLPETLTDAQRRDTNWRPTLRSFSLKDLRASSDEIYHTAEGSQHPSLVQVQSRNKPYLISVHDYNRMVLLRRDSLIKSKLSGNSVSNKTPSINVPSATVTSATIAALSALTPASTTIEIEKPTGNKSVGNAAVTNTTSSNTTILNVPNRKVVIPNKILEQNSLIPLGSHKQSIDSNTDSLLKIRKHPTSLLKSNATLVSKPNQMGPMAINVSNHLNAGNKVANSLVNSLAQSNAVSIISTPSISSILAMGNSTPTSTPPPSMQMNQSQPITITSVGSLASGAECVANLNVLHELLKNSQMQQPQIQPRPQTMQQWVESLNRNSNMSMNMNSVNGIVEISTIENSTSSILSKIPKSLTVIPQKRLSAKSTEDN